MSIESLKEQARKHEQKEDWKKALDQYNKALAELAREEQVDIGLYNRVGDLHVRVGQLDQAVEHYEKAVDLYREAYLPNNAIAVCKKIIRNVPERHKAYLKIGQIRAEQGFLPDARTNFLTYAERMQQTGDLDESFRALIEFCDLAPDDVGVRITVADQMAANGRNDEAVEQLMTAHRHLTQIGETGQAEDLGTKILAIDPEADLGALPAMSTSSVGDDGEIVAEFGEISLGGDGFGDSEDSEAAAAVGAAMEEEAADSADAGVDAEIGADKELDGFDIAVDGGEEEPPVELPTMDFEVEADDGKEEGVELPTMESEVESDDDEGEGVELPTMDLEVESHEEEAVALPTMDFEVETEEGDEEAVALPTMDFEVEAEEGDEEAVALPTMDFEVETEEGDEEAVALPTMDLEVETEEGDEEAVALPTMDFEVETDHGDEVVALPTMDFEREDEREGEGRALPTTDLEVEVDADDREGVEVASAVEAEDPNAGTETNSAVETNDSEGAETSEFDVSASSEAVEDAVEEAAGSEVGEVAIPAGEGSLVEGADGPDLPADATSTEDGPAEADEVAADTPPATAEKVPDEGYVDLGAMILGGRDDTEKSTRFTVAYEEPSGDEDADFAKMLSQFKQKVSENLDADDVRAHYDLGTAYKEMGLLDEAISSFQAALRAAPDHLPTYEVMGQTFIEMGQNEAAVKSLERALKAESTIEDELLGIYYYLARAYESLDNKTAAVEYYDRVFSLDINFADVTERLRELR